MHNTEFSVHLTAVSQSPIRHLYLPDHDRSFWKNESRNDALSLLYLAWGRRDFSRRGIPISTHQGWVCVLIEDGSPTIIINGSERKLTSGNVVFIREDCPFGWALADSRACKFLLWMWRKPLHSELARLPKIFSSLHTVPAGQQNDWRQLHAGCREEILDPDEFSSVWLESCQRQLEVQLLRLMRPTGKEKSREALLRHASAWMQLHLDSAEPVARLCDFLNVSQPTLHRLFTAATGESALAHFHKLKMQRAMELIASGEESIKAIAFSLGYRHTNDFSRAYRQHFGNAPSTRKTGRQESSGTSLVMRP